MTNDPGSDRTNFNFISIPSKYRYTSYKSSGGKFRTLPCDHYCIPEVVKVNEDEDNCDEGVARVETCLSPLYILSVFISFRISVILKMNIMCRNNFSALSSNTFFKCFQLILSFGNTTTLLFRRNRLISLFNLRRYLFTDTYRYLWRRQYRDSLEYASPEKGYMHSQKSNIYL